MRRTVGTSRKPLSSRKTRWALSRSAFFYLRPDGALPGRDGRLVALAGPLHRLLDAPAQALEEAPQMVGMVVDPEALLDHAGHALLRPQVRGVAVAEGPG